MNPIVLSAILLSGLVAAPRSSPCVPEGGGKTVTVDFVTNDSASVRGWESDPGFDDSLGHGSIKSTGGNANTGSITIRNNDGDLSGPNGVTQHGFGEGCLEVSLVVTFTHTGQTGASGSAGAVGGSISGEVNVPGSNTYTLETEPVEACAC